MGLRDIRPLRGRRILLTAGPTRESLDPVRYLSNHSSGEMGLVLAGRLAALGARVTVVLGPVSRARPAGIKIVDVESARQMSAAVKRRLAAADVFVATAAVCDWRFRTVHPRKMKKNGARELSVRLVRNPDILAEAGERKRRIGRGPLLVGFALETGALEARAKGKLRAKSLDLVIGNTPASFGSEAIKPLWIEKSGLVRRLPRMTKKALSSEIARWISREAQSR